MTRYFLSLLFCLFSIIVKKQQAGLSGIYYSAWAETIWTYDFDSSNIFVFKSSGHFGNTSTIGEYHLSGDSIFIKAFPKERQTDSDFIALTDTLLKDGDSCIIDLSLGYDYCKVNPNNDTIYHSRQRIKLNGDLVAP
jgi:hypothetical protein